MSDIATRLKCALGDTGISKKKLSQMTGITEVTIGRYVNGSRVPKATTLAQIADALGVGMGYFFDSVDKDINVPSTDTISRQAAIMELDKYIATLIPDKDNKELWRVNSIKSFIKQFPSAQPDTGLYTDGFNDGYKQAQADAQQDRMSCNGCWREKFGSPVCNLCARSFQDRYRSAIRMEGEE